LIQFMDINASDDRLSYKSRYKLNFDFSRQNSNINNYYLWPYYRVWGTLQERQEESP